MVKVSVLYPNRKDTKFDMEYYCNRHIPWCGNCSVRPFKGASVDQGPHAQAIMQDIPKYTNAEPTIQISEIKL